MDLFELAKTITIKKEGDVNDFIDYLIIVRKWLDSNYYLAEELHRDFNVSYSCALNDNRFKTLREQIWRKPMHNENIKPKERWRKRLLKSRLVVEVKEKQKRMLQEFMGGDE